MFETVGENVLFVPMPSKDADKRTMEDVAEQMYQSWKKSSGHYANMIGMLYSHGGLSFRADPIEKRLYATHVLGQKGVVVAGQLSPNAFGIQYEEGHCDEFLQQWFNILVSMGDDISIEGRHVYLKYHDKAFFKEMFSDKVNFSLAVDLVRRSQYTCEGENQLDASPIYDGVILKPITIEQILAKNEAKGDYRLVVKIGEIPPSLLPYIHELKASIVVVRDGFFCDKIDPIGLPGEDYDLLPVKPKLLKPKDVVLPKLRHYMMEEVVFEFASGQLAFSEPPHLDKNPREVASVEIVSYSSVDGDSAKNIALHEGRAKAILDFLKKNRKIEGKPTKTTVKENWERMNFQLKMMGKNAHLDSSKQVIRQFVNANRANMGDYLAEQRKSKAIIYYQKSPTDPSLPPDEHRLMALREAVLANNPFVANLAMYELAKNDSVSYDFLFEEAIFSKIKEDPRLAQNSAALLSMRDDLDELLITEFVDKWVDKSEKLSPDATGNLINLYNKSNLELLRSWDVPAQRLAKVVTPVRVLAILKDNLAKEVVVNFNLSAIKYYGQINDTRMIIRMLKYLSDYFEENAKSIDDIIKLSLYLNHWSWYHGSIGLLEGRMKEKDFSKEALLLFLKTATIYPKDMSETILLDLHQKATTKVPQEWCRWVEGNFTLMKNAWLKNKFCEICR